MEIVPEPLLWSGDTSNKDTAIKTFTLGYLVHFSMTLLLSKITCSPPSKGDIITSVLKSLNYSVNTYIHDEEVKPTPGIGEVFDKAVCDPFQEHLQDENIGEDLVCILQHYFDGLSLLDVNVLKCLSRTEAVKCAD